MSIDKAQKVRPGEELPWSKIESYLREHLDFIEGPFSFSQFHGGHANLTYLLRFGKQELVLRRPPLGKIAPGAHDMHREYKVLKALHPVFDRAPQAYHYCKDKSIIGSHFVLMERRQGTIVRSEVPEPFKPVDQIEDKLTRALMTAIADLHKIDINTPQMLSLGKTDGYLERQLKGWTKRWKLCQTEENIYMEDILTYLPDNMPNSSLSAIVHNDLKLDNCQFDPLDPTRVQSIFDWDMTTIGDPLSDVGMTLAFYPDDRLPLIKKLPNIVHGDFPHKDKLKEIYQDLTGFDMSKIKWYEILSFVKCAIIAQQLYKRYFDGETKDKRMAGFGHIANAMIKLGHSMISKS